MQVLLCMQDMCTSVQFMGSKTHIHIYSRSLTNKEDHLQNQEHFIPVTLSHHLKYLNIVDVQGKTAGRKCHSKEEVL